MLKLLFVEIKEIELFAHELLKLFLHHDSISIYLRRHLEACITEIILRCVIAVIIACRSRCSLGVNGLRRSVKRVIAFILFETG